MKRNNNRKHCQYTNNGRNKSAQGNRSGTGKTPLRNRDGRKAASADIPHQNHEADVSGEPKLDQAAFAQLFMARAREKFGITDLVYDQDKGVIHNHTGDRTMGLHNIHAFYHTAKADARESVLDTYAQLWLADHRLPSTFAEAMDRIFPVILNRGMHQVGEMASADKDALPILTFPLTDDLIVAIVVDEPTCCIRLTIETPADWGVDADTIFGTALQNLRQSLLSRIMVKGVLTPIEEFSAQSGFDVAQLLAMMHPITGQSPAPQADLKEGTLVTQLTIADLGFSECDDYPGVYSNNSDDWYSPSRILLPVWIQVLGVKGDPVAMVTHGGYLLVTGADDAAGLMGLAELARQRESMGHPVSNIPIRLTADGWRTYQPAPAHPAYTALHDLHSIEVVRCYHFQRQILFSMGQGFVADCMMTGNKGAAKTLCTWTKEVGETLLPKTDFVVLASLDRATNQVRVFMPPVPWADVIAIVGHRMEATDYWPPRFRVRSFPSDHELAQLATRASTEFSMPRTGK